MIDDRDKKLLRNFGRNLKKLRLEKELTIRELATSAGVYPSTITRIEQGHTNPSLTTLCDLADALEIAPADLLPDK